MPLLFKAISTARLLEYLRSEIDPAKYNPDELNPIADVRFGGKCWGSLGLARPTLDNLRTMAKGNDPITGDRLTARRIAPDSKRPATALYSAVFNVPKSVSIASEIGGDHRIRQAVHDSATGTLDVMQEQYVGIRVRKKTAPDRDKHRNTGAMAWVTFLANESRFLDPHLHVHGAIPNVTPDLSDPKRPYKALDVTRVYPAQKILTQSFNAGLRSRLEELGYQTITTPRNAAFEIAGIPESLIGRFSKANRAIKAAGAVLAVEARMKGQDVSLARMEAKAADKIRPKKRRVFQNRLVPYWKSAITHAEFAIIAQVVGRALGRLGPHALHARASGPGSESPVTLDPRHHATETNLDTFTSSPSNDDDSRAMDM